MKYIFCKLLVLLLLLSACGGKPVPAWRSAAVSHLDAYREAFLRGDDSRAEILFQKALQEIRASGDLQLLAKAHLIRAALQTAVLEPVTDQDFLELEDLYPSEENRNYYYFITAQFDQLDPTFLPAHYLPAARAFQSGEPTAMRQALDALDDPLPHLIVAALWLDRQSEMVAPHTLQRAVDLASHQGWQRAVVAWLTEQQKAYQALGDTSNAQRLMHRLRIISP